MPDKQCCYRFSQYEGVGTTYFSIFVDLTFLQPQFFSSDNVLIFVTSKYLELKRK